MDLKLPNSEGSEEFKVPPFAALRRSLLWAGMRFCHHDTDTESLGGGRGSRRRSSSQPCHRDMLGWGHRPEERAGRTQPPVQD